MRLVVGLGNYGAQYERTYHNLGFMAIDKIASILNQKVKKRECDSLVCQFDDIVLAKPLTYMNLSGVAIKKLIKRFDVGLDDLIVVYDDIDLQKGAIRVRKSGSAGTHNGMRNIIAEIKSGEFCRVRIGAGRPDESQSLADYVLSPIPFEDRQLFCDALEGAAQEVFRLLGINP